MGKGTRWNKVELEIKRDLCALVTILVVRNVWKAVDALDLFVPPHRFAG